MIETGKPFDYAPFDCAHGKQGRPFDYAPFDRLMVNRAGRSSFA